jgi:hypothetical protein
MVRAMLTTLDLDDDVLASARALAERQRRSIDAVISELARRGLAPAPPLAAVRNGIRLFPVREGAGTAADLLERMRQRAQAGGLLDQAALDRLDAAQDDPRRSSDPWMQAEN